MKAVLLDKETLGSDINLEPIKNVCSLEAFEQTKMSQIVDNLKNADIAILNKIKLTKEILEQLPSLKLICVAATGYDNIDVSYCKERGIGVCNVVDYSTHSVAQITVSMVLSLVNNFKYFNEYVSNGSYTNNNKANCVEPVFNELYGKTWGIVGFGNIGKEVGRIAEAFGCKIIVCKNKKIDDYYCTSINELCEKSDIITIHTPLTEKTRGLIGKEQIDLMKKNAIVVNTARGLVIDEKAFSDAILNNKIGGFGTDVYSIEPFSKEHSYNKILDCYNVCLTPHMAWGAYEARNRCMSEIAENIICYLNGEIRNRVDLI